MRSGFASGAASSAKSGTMWIEHGARARLRGSTEAARPRANLMPARDSATTRRRCGARTFAGQSWRPTASQSTSTASKRAASARTRSTVCASTGWSASIFWVTKTSRSSAGGAGDRRVDQRPHLARELLRRRVPVGVPRPRGRAHLLGKLAVAEHAREGGRQA